MKKLHPTQKKLLSLLKENSDTPFTIRELQAELGASSTSVVYHHIFQLEKKGLIKRNPSNPSDYQITSDTTNSLVYINLYGFAQCGPAGRLLDGNPTDRIPFSPKLIGMPADQAFLVRARGDSMEPRIYEGDLVLARKAGFAASGDIVVCVHKGEVLIKKFIIADNTIRLESLNPVYETLAPDPPAFGIEGIVKGVFSSNFM